MPDLEDLYRRYLACCNERRFANMAEYVHDEIRFNGQPTSLADYVASIASNIEAVPTTTGRSRTSPRPRT